MFSALNNRLRMLADDQRGSFHGEVRKLVGHREAVRVADDLRRMVLALPDMLAQIKTWSLDPGLPWDFRRLYGFVLVYVGDVEDFLPEREKGLFGYVDDAYLAGRILARAMDEVKVRPHRGNVTLAASIPGWLSTAKRLLPNETARIDRIVLGWRDGAGDNIQIHARIKQIA